MLNMNLEERNTMRDTLLVSVITAISLLLISVVSFYIPYLLNGITLTRDRLIVVQIFMSLATSTFLVAVYTALVLSYRDQIDEMSKQAGEAERSANLQERMRDLQQEQNKTLAGNHIPVLQVTPKEYSSSPSKHDYVKFDVENKGNGLAQNIRISANSSMEMKIGGTIHHIDISEASSRGGPEGLSPTINQASIVGKQRTEFVLQPGDKEECRGKITFSDRVFSKKDNNIVTKDYKPLSKAIKKLDSSHPIEVSFTIFYRDIFGEEESTEFYSYRFESDEEVDVDSLFE